MTFQNFYILSKFRLCSLALLMSCLGFFLIRTEYLTVPLFLSMLIGLALVGFSSGFLNQYIEVESDKKMKRTMTRPLVKKEVTEETVLIWGCALGVIGVGILLFFVNVITALLGVLTLVTYLFMYTPLKKINSFSTIVGAIPGALPPLMGYTAAHNEMAWPGLLIFLIIFCWQVPHFLAIAWLYKEEYEKAGFKVLPVVDKTGRKTAYQILLYTVLLLPLSLVPYIKGLSGGYYFFVALLLGLIFLVLSTNLAVYPTKKNARRVFLYSILYLPILGGFMIGNGP
jgi:protoheme IX farnesyltransferase